MLALGYLTRRNLEAGAKQHYQIVYYINCKQQLFKVYADITTKLTHLKRLKVKWEMCYT